MKFFAVSLLALVLACESHVSARPIEQEEVSFEIESVNFNPSSINDDEISDIDTDDGDISFSSYNSVNEELSSESADFEILSCSKKWANDINDASKTGLVLPVIIPHPSDF
jgi:type 1 fimbria pilin